MAVHFASPEDRQRIRDDLRSQLNLTERPSVPTIMPTTQSVIAQQQQPSLPNTHRSSLNYIINTAEEAARIAGEPRYIIASTADAARLEEMMMMEAIRRSMQDVTIGINEEAISSPTIATTISSPQRRPSTNPFDSPHSSYQVQRRSSNPFDPPYSVRQNL